MWGEQSRRSVVEDFPVSIKKIKIEGALSFNDQKLAALCDDLNQLKKLEIENNKYSEGKYPWAGVWPKQRGPSNAKVRANQWQARSQAFKCAFHTGQT